MSLTRQMPNFTGIQYSIHLQFFLNAENTEITNAVFPQTQFNKSLHCTSTVGSERN